MYSDMMDRMRLGLDGYLSRFWASMERGETVLIPNEFWELFGGGY